MAAQLVLGILEIWMNQFLLLYQKMVTPYDCLYVGVALSSLFLGDYLTYSCVCRHCCCCRTLWKSKL